MSLQNLKSVFTEDFESRSSDFQSNSPLLGESIIIDMTSDYTDGIGGIFNSSTTYESSKFTPMSSLNVPSTYFADKSYKYIDKNILPAPIIKLDILKFILININI